MSFDCRRTNCLHRLGFLPNFVKELEQRRRKLRSGQCCNRKCWDQRKRKNHLISEPFRVAKRAHRIKELQAKV